MLLLLVVILLVCEFTNVLLNFLFSVVKIILHNTDPHLYFFSLFLESIHETHVQLQYSTQESLVYDNDSLPFVMIYFCTQYYFFLCDNIISQSCHFFRCLKTINSKKYGVELVCFTDNPTLVLYSSKNGWDGKSCFMLTQE